MWMFSGKCYLAADNEFGMRCNVMGLVLNFYFEVCGCAVLYANFICRLHHQLMRRPWGTQQKLEVSEIKK